MRIPRFNKGLDEREDETLWTVQRGKVDVVLYEGWRVGVDHPDYARFNEAIDCLVCLDADADAIREWKVESSRRDALAAGKPFDEAKIRKAFDEQIMPFVNIYEKPLLARADLVLKKEASHAIQRFDRSLVDKLEAVAERAAEAQRAAGDASGQLPLSVVEEALSSLGLRSASRWVWELLARRGVRHTLTKEQFVSVLSVAVDSSTSAGAASFWFRQPRVRRASKGAVVAPGAPPFRCASGTSKLKHTADAAAAAAAQIAEALAAGDEPSVLVVYVTANHDAHALRATLRALYPRALLHGCTSCGGVMSHRGALADAGAHALALYAICDAGGGYATAYAVAPDGSAAAAEAAGVEAALGAMRGLHAGVTAAEAEPPDVLYVSSFPAREEDVLRGIGSVYGKSVPVFGRAARCNGAASPWDGWLVARGSSLPLPEGSGPASNGRGQPTRQRRGVWRQVAPNAALTPLAPHLTRRLGGRRRPHRRLVAPHRRGRRAPARQGRRGRARDGDEPDGPRGDHADRAARADASLGRRDRRGRRWADDREDRRPAGGGGVRRVVRRRDRRQAARRRRRAAEHPGRDDVLPARAADRGRRRADGAPPDPPVVRAPAHRRDGDVCRRARGRDAAADERQGGGDRRRGGRRHLEGGRVGGARLRAAVGRHGHLLRRLLPRDAAAHRAGGREHQAWPRLRRPGQALGRHR